jgi:sugar/nucleoside kinase (ribokinase family)
VKSRVGEICRDFWAQYHTCIILTRGSRPVWYAEAGGLEEYSFEPVSPVVNTVGSGDAFTAGLAAALGDGACLKDAVARGVWCGGRNARFFRIGVIDGPTEDNLSVQP